MTDFRAPGSEAVGLYRELNPDCVEHAQWADNGGPAQGDGETDDRAALLAVDEVRRGEGSPGRTYLIRADTTLTHGWKANRSIIDGPAGASPKPVLTINGPFEAGLYQCFGSNVTVTFSAGACERLHPQWWYTGTDGTLTSAAINTALQVAKNGVKHVHLVDGTYYIGDTILGADWCVLSMERNAVLVPTAAVDVVQLYGRGFRFGGGVIDVSSLGAAFAGKSAILMTEINGTMGYYPPTILPTRIEGDYHVCAGYGFRVYFNNAAPLGIAIYYPIIEALEISNMDKGISLVSYGAVVTGNTNSYHFKNVRMYGNKDNFEIDGVNVVMVDDLVMQWTSTNTVPTTSGLVVNNASDVVVAHFRMWDATPPANILYFGPNTTKCHILAGAGINDCATDLGVANTVLEDYTRHAQTEHVLPNIIMYQGGGASHQISYGGNQDDVLAYATNAGSGITVTSVPSPGTEANMFDLLGSTYATYAAGQNPVITINMASLALTLNTLGVAFSNTLAHGLSAGDTVLMELYYSGAWHTLYSYTEPAATYPRHNFVVSQVPYFGGGVSQARITIANAAEIRIVRIWGHAWGVPGRAFAPPSSPNFVGRVTMQERGRLIKLAADPTGAEGDFCAANRPAWDPLGVGAGACYPVYHNGTTWVALSPPPRNSVATTPAYVGQVAVVAGVGYIATGTSSSADWKQITN